MQNDINSGQIEFVRDNNGAFVSQPSNNSASETDTNAFQEMFMLMQQLFEQMEAVENATIEDGSTGDRSGFGTESNFGGSADNFIGSEGGGFGNDGTTGAVGDGIDNRPAEGFSDLAPTDGGQIIEVSDAGGLESAIASAQDGDVIKLAGDTVYTLNSPLEIDKNISIDGGEGTVIDGGGISEDGKGVINLSEGASGATIQDVEVTNGNSGIVGNGAKELTLNNLNINNMGLDQPIKEGQNNTGIRLGKADGSIVSNSTISDVGRKGISVGELYEDGVGVTITGNTISRVNLDGHHAQNHDAAGIKFFDTTNVVVDNNELSEINANYIWADTVNDSTISNNTLLDVGSVFKPASDKVGTGIDGIYDEKNYYTDVTGNTVTAVAEGSFAYKVTEDSSETYTESGNNFTGGTEIGSKDYYVNEEAERLVARSDDPAHNYSTFGKDYEDHLNKNG